MSPKESNSNNEKKPTPDSGLDLFNPEHEYKVFLNNSKNLQAAWQSDQDKYAQLCYAAVNEAVEDLNTEKIKSGIQLFEFLAKKRHDIAIELKQEHAEGIGMMRKPTNIKSPSSYLAQVISTPVMSYGRYSGFAEKTTDIVRDFFKPENKSNNLIILTNENYNSYTGNYKINKPDVKDYAVVVEDGMWLTGYAIMNPQLKFMLGNFIFLHTPVDTVPKIMDKINVIFDKIMKEPHATSANVKKIAEIAWYLAHAMPCLRGSAATTEILTRVIMKKIGLPLVPYEGEMPMDFEALLEPNKKSFIERFETKLYPKLPAYYQPEISAKEENNQLNSSSFFYPNLKQKMQTTVDEAKKWFNNTKK